MNEQENEPQASGQEEGRHDIKDVAGKALAQGRKLLDRTANSSIVQKTIATLKEEFANGKAWCVVNWANGRYGKFRVVAVAAMCLLAFKGLFFGWGASSADVRLAHETAAMEKAVAEADAQRAKDEKERADQEAGLRFLGALLGSGGGESSSSSSSSSRPQIHIWTCRKCGRQIQSGPPPSTQIQCRAWSGRNDGTKNCQFSRSDY